MDLFCDLPQMENEITDRALGHILILEVQKDFILHLAHVFGRIQFLAMQANTRRNELTKTIEDRCMSDLRSCIASFCIGDPVREKEYMRESLRIQLQFENMYFAD